MNGLMRRFIHFETPEGVIPDGPTGAEPAAPEPAAPAAPEAQPWEEPLGTLGEHIGVLAQGQQELYDLLSGSDQQPAAAPDQQPSGPEWDPLDPDSVRAFVRHEATGLAEQMFQERIGPYEHVLGTTAEQQGRQIALDEFTKLEQGAPGADNGLGSFDHEQALGAVQALISAGVEPLQAVEVAAHRQAEFERALLERGRAEWEAEREQHLNNLTEAPNEPGGGGAALQQPAAPQNPHEAARQGGPSRYEAIGLQVVGRQQPSAA